METSEVRRRPASYAVQGDESVDRTFPLDDGERIVERGRCRVQRGWRAPLAFYRVSTARLCLVVHRAVVHDDAMSIPLAAITVIDPPDGRGRMTLQLGDRTELVLRPFSWREAGAAVAKVDGLRPLYDTLVS